MEIYQGSYKSMLEHPQQERHGRRRAACRQQAQARAPRPWQSAGPTSSGPHGHVAQFTGGHISATRFEAFKSPCVQLVPYMCLSGK